MNLAQRIAKQKMDKSKARGRQCRDATEAEAQRHNNAFLRAELAKRQKGQSLSQRIAANRSR